MIGQIPGSNPFLYDNNIKQTGIGAQPKSTNEPVLFEGNSVQTNTQTTQNPNYQTDTQQLLEDASYFADLKERLLDGDTSAITEINSLTPGAKVDGNDPNAQLYNSNTDLLVELQGMTKSAEGNKSDKDNNGYVLNQFDGSNEQLQQDIMQTLKEQGYTDITDEDVSNYIAMYKLA